MKWVGLGRGRNLDASQDSDVIYLDGGPRERQGGDGGEPEFSGAHWTCHLGDI